MIAQWDNKVMSAFMLYIDYTVCKQGKAFTNHTGSFYPIESRYDNLWAYALPYKQIISDSALIGSGANVLQTLQVDGVTHDAGSGDMYGIIHHKGQVLFTSSAAHTVTGSYSVKDFNVYLTTKLEEDILFNKKYQTNPRVNQALAGLKDEEESWPAIYLKNMGGHNDPLCLGGVDNVKIFARAVILSDSAYKLDAICSILKNTARKEFPIPPSLPFNSIGAYTGVMYNYQSILNSATELVPIWDVKVTKISTSDLNGVDPRVFPAFVDFEIHGYGKNA